MVGCFLLVGWMDGSVLGSTVRGWLDYLRALFIWFSWGVGLFICLFVGWLFAAWLVCLFDRLVGSLIGLLFDWMVQWLVHLLLVGCVICAFGCLVCLLVSW